MGAQFGQGLGWRPMGSGPGCRAPDGRPLVIWRAASCFGFLGPLEGIHQEAHGPLFRLTRRHVEGCASGAPGRSHRPAANPQPA